MGAGFQEPRAKLSKCQKGTNGVGTNGVIANFMFFDGGTFWVLPSTYVYLPKSARAYLFPLSVKIRYFCSGPIGVDPIRPRPKVDWPRAGAVRDLLVAPAAPASSSPPRLPSGGIAAPGSCQTVAVWPTLVVFVLTAQYVDTYYLSLSLSLYLSIYLSMYIYIYI